MYTRPEIAAVIAKRTLDVHDTHALQLAVAGFLLEQNKVDQLDSIMRDVLAYRAEHGYVEVTIVSAYPVDAAVKQDVLVAVKQEFPGAKSYVVNEKIDESVVGGLRIEFAGEELDLTVKAKLNVFKRLTAARKD